MRSFALPARDESLAFRRATGRSLVYSWLVACVISCCVVLVPWDQISGQGFPDRDNYVATIDVLMNEGARSFDTGDENILALVLNEYLWREILIGVGNHFRDPIDGLELVSFVALALTCWMVVQRAGWLYGVLFAVAPLTIDLFISQTRSALALALFAVALQLRSRALRYLLMLGAFMIHSVGALFIAIYVFDEVVLARKWMRGRHLILASVGLALSLSAVWVFLSSGIFASVGDRRADQETMMPVTFTFSLVWIAVMVIIVCFSRVEAFRFKTSVPQEIMFGLALLGMFLFGTAFGVGALRFLALALPFVFVAIRCIRDQVLRSAALGGIVLFNLIHASYWVQ